MLKMYHNLEAISLSLVLVIFSLASLRFAREVKGATLVPDVWQPYLG